MTPQKGGWLWTFGDHFFGAEGAEKWELLKIFGQNYVQWPIFGAAGAENFVKFRYFSEKSPNFVKTEDFIAQLCIKWRKKSRKPLYIGYFFEFCSVTTFSENPPVRWPKPWSPPPLNAIPDHYAIVEYSMTYLHMIIVLDTVTLPSDLPWPIYTWKPF